MTYLSHQNQAFSPSHIRSIIPIFREKAERVCILQTTHQTPLSHLCPQLRDIFLQLVDAPSPQSAAHSQPVSPASPPPITVNVLTWLGRATLDVIGEAGTFLYQFRSVPLLYFVSGFGYSFHSLPPPGKDPHSSDESENELARAFAAVFSTGRPFGILNVLYVWFPFLRRFVRSFPFFFGRMRPPNTHGEVAAAGITFYARGSSHNPAH